MFLWLQQSDDSEETQSKEYDFEDTAIDFGKILFLTSVSSRVSSPIVLYSLGPTDEDIEVADEGPPVFVTIGETAAEMPSQGHASKDPDVIVTVGEATVGMPSQRHVASSIVHDVYQSKESSGIVILSYLH